MLHLDPVNKFLLIVGATAAVVISIFVVVCFVGDGCLIHDILSNRKSIVDFGYFSFLFSFVIVTEKKKLDGKMSGTVYGAPDTNGVNLMNYATCGKEMVHLQGCQDLIVQKWRAYMYFLIQV